MTRTIKVPGKKEKEKKTRPVFVLCQLRTESIRSVPDVNYMILFVTKRIQDGLEWGVYP